MRPWFPCWETSFISPTFLKQTPSNHCSQNITFGRLASLLHAQLQLLVARVHLPAATSRADISCNNRSAATASGKEKCICAPRYPVRSSLRLAHYDEPREKVLHSLQILNLPMEEVLGRSSLHCQFSHKCHRQRANLRHWIVDTTSPTGKSRAIHSHPSQ